MYGFKWTLRLRIIGSPFCTRVECEMIPILIPLFVNLLANSILFCNTKPDESQLDAFCFFKLIIKKHKETPKYVKVVPTNDHIFYHNFNAWNLLRLNSIK